MLVSYLINGWWGCMIVGSVLLMLICSANQAKIHGLSFQIQPQESRRHHAGAVGQEAELGSPHRQHSEQQWGLTDFDSGASCGNNPSSLSGFSSDHLGMNIPSVLGDSPHKVSSLPQAFQRVAIVSPLWPETSQSPSLTTSVVIPAVDSLAEYQPRWSSKVAFSGLCHPQKWYICHNHHCL